MAGANKVAKTAESSPSSGAGHGPSSFPPPHPSWDLSYFFFNGSSHIETQLNFISPSLSFCVWQDIYEFLR